jgi:predicted ATP-dependent protease
VDGDSASCAEFFALLSAIAQIPLRQDLAVTGSLNQLGDVQPVGGIPEKIEGFFETCSILGLTGTQGVIIPRRNLPNLMPSDRVQAAVEDGLFHIWAIDTVEEGISLLAPVTAEEFGKKVREALLEHARHMRDFRK